MPVLPLRPLEEVATPFFPVDWITASPLCLAAATNAPLPAEGGATPDDLDVPLYLAIRARADASVRALIGVGASMGTLRCNRTTPLWEAVAEGHGPSIEALLETGRCDLLTHNRTETVFAQQLRRDMDPWIIERIMRALADLPPCTFSGHTEPSPIGDAIREMGPRDGEFVFALQCGMANHSDARWRKCPHRGRHLEHPGRPEECRTRRDEMILEAWRMAVRRFPPLIVRLLAMWPGYARDFVRVAIQAKDRIAARFVLERQPVDQSWVAVAAYAARECPRVYEYLLERGLDMSEEAVRSFHERQDALHSPYTDAAECTRRALAFPKRPPPTETRALGQ